MALFAPWLPTNVIACTVCISALSSRGTRAVDITDMEIVALGLGLELGEDQTVIVSESQMAHSRLDECDDM